MVLHYSQLHENGKHFGVPTELQLSKMSQQDSDNNWIHRLRQSAYLYSFLCLYIILCSLSMPPRSKAQAPGSPTKSRRQNGTILRQRHLSHFFITRQIGLETQVSRKHHLLLQQLLSKNITPMVPLRQLHIVEQNGQV